MRKTAIDRFMEKVSPEPNSGCWLWVAAISPQGYSRFGFDREVILGHRFSFEFFIGPIPNGLVINHRCEVRSCVNPEHLETVTHHENVLYSLPRRVLKTHCKNGHPFSGSNLSSTSTGARRCLACHRNLTRKYRSIEYEQQAGRMAERH